MGYFKDLLDRPIQRPPEDVAVINSYQVYQQSVTLILERSRRRLAKFNLKVKGTNGIKYFKGKIKNSKETIYSLENSPLFNINDSNFGRTKKNICLGKDNGKLVATIKSRGSSNKYKIKFENLISEQPGFFEMNSDKKLVICGIFYGKEEEGAPLICKIIRDKKKSTKCTVEIAPGVDNIFMIGIAAFFSNRSDFNNSTNPNTFIPIRNNSYLSDDSISHYSTDNENNDTNNNNDDNDDNKEYSAYGYNSYNDCDYDDGDDGGDDGGDCGDGGGCDGGD